MDKGADIHAKNETGENALHQAAIYGNFEVLQLLVESGADLESATNDQMACLALGS